jgi:DNA polymerase III delta subunit
MIIFLYGEDNWRKIQRKKEIIKNFKEKNPDIIFNIINIDLEEKSIDSFLEIIQGQSIFENKKFIILSGLFSNENKNSKKLKEEIKLALKNNNLHILIQEKEKPPTNFSFLLKKPVICEKFEKLKGQKWKNFILNEIKKRNLNLTSSALNLISEVYEGNSFAFIMELEKIALLNKKTIDLKDLNNVDIEIKPDFNFVFKDLASSNLKQRLNAFENLISLKEDSAKIFNILAYFWSEKTQFFAVYDRAIKSGKLDYEEALLDIIL